MSSDQPLPQQPTFKSRAERRRYEKQQAAKPVVQCTPRAHKQQGAAATPTREQARAQVGKTRAQEQPHLHTRSARFKDGISHYAFIVYRADGQRSVTVWIDANIAAHIRRRRKGETMAEAARRRAHQIGADQLVEDVLAGAPVDVQPQASAEAMVLLSGRLATPREP